MNRTEATTAAAAAFAAEWGRPVTADAVHADGQRIDLAAEYWPFAVVVSAGQLKKMAKGLGIAYTGKNPTAKAVFAAVRAELAA